MENKKIDLRTIDGFSQTIVKYKGSIQKFLNPKYGITPEDFIETCIRVVREKPNLLQCDPKSLFGSILFCAEIGLKPNTPLGHAFILPYKGKAKFQIGYKGLIEIMYRNPRVKQITARAVFKNDFFEYNYGLRPDLVHKPSRTEKGELECVYATCLIDDAPVFVVVEKAELDEIKKISPSFTNADSSHLSAYNNGTDVHNWMEIKAGVKALSKLIPTSNNIDMAKAVEYDSKFEGGARALVEIPSNEDEIVEPKLIGGDNLTKTLDTAFDFVDEMKTNEQPQPIEQNINPNPIQENVTPIKIQNPIQDKQKEESISEKLQAFKLAQSTEVTPNEQDNFEWELPIDSNLNNEGVDDSDEEDDISFDFPDNDDEDEDDMDGKSTLF